MARKTTARDVAVSRGRIGLTVDRVLNGRGGVDPDKERRVVEWARKLKLSSGVAPPRRADVAHRRAHSIA